MARLDNKNLLTLIELIYEAGLDPGQWPKAIEAMAQELGYSSGIIADFDLRDDWDLKMMIPYNWSDKSLQAMNDYFFQINPFEHLLLEHTRPGIAYSSYDMVSEAEIENTEYYRDFLTPNDVHYMSGVFLFRDGTRIANLDFQRSRNAKPVGPDDVAALQKIAPHVTRAFQLNRQYWDLQENQSSFTDLIDLLPNGFILIDEDGRVAHLNGAAERIVQGQNGLRVTGNQLRAWKPLESEHLAALIQVAVMTGRGTGTHSGGAITISRSENLLPLQVLVSPLRTDRAKVGAPGQRICAVVMIGDPNDKAKMPEVFLQQLYGLTPSEARLTAELAEGNSMQEIAARHELSKETLRSQLRSVFDKTGTRRQAELIRRILTSPAGTLLQSDPGLSKRLS